MTSKDLGVHGALYDLNPGQENKLVELLFIHATYCFGRKLSKRKDITGTRHHSNENMNTDFPIFLHS